MCKFKLQITSVKDYGNEKYDANSVTFDVIGGTPTAAGVICLIEGHSSSVCNVDYNPEVQAGCFTDLTCEYSVGQTLTNTQTDNSPSGTFSTNDFRWFSAEHINSVLCKQFNYYWTALNLMLNRDITLRTFIRVLKDKPDAVCGRGGSFGLTDLDMNNSNPIITIQIIKSHTPAGSAIDGEYAWATFKVLSTADAEPISKKDMQNLVHKWNFDCELQRFGNIGDTDIQAGVMVFVDDYPPKEGELISLNF